jgi:tetratricopeptide (TPR) repeat protein/TolB-like protein
MKTNFRNHPGRPLPGTFRFLLLSSLSSLLLLSFAVLIGCQGCGKKREDQQFQLVNQREKQARETTRENFPSTYMAVFLFENRSADSALDWLSTGITELLILDLSRCSEIDVLSRRQLRNILQDMGKEMLPLRDQTAVAEVALRAGADVTVTGSFNKRSEMLYLSAQLRDVFSGYTINIENLQGTGLASVFSLVDQLSRTIQNKLDICSAEQSQGRGIMDATTSSIDAYQAYVEGLNVMEKLGVAQGLIHFERAVELDSSFAMPYAILARYWHDIGDLARAESSALKATTLADRLPEADYKSVATDSNFAIARAMVAMYLHGIGDKSRALDATQKAIALLDKIPESDKSLILAIDAQLKGNYDQGMEYYLGLMKSNAGKSNPFLHMGLARLYFDTRRLEEASDLYRGLLQSDPELAFAHFMMGLIQLRQNQPDSAQIELQETIRLNPKLIGAHLLLAQIYSSQAQVDKAEFQRQQVLQLDPDNPLIYNHLGYQYLAEKNYHQAIAAFKQYVALAPNDPDSHDSLGEGYFLQGDLIKAEEEYLRAIELDPNFANSHYMLARIYEQQGETKKAISHLNTYLKLSPKGLRATIAEKRLDLLQKE